MLVLRVLENTFDACALSRRTLEVISSTVCGYAADYVGDRGAIRKQHQSMATSSLRALVMGQRCRLFKHHRKAVILIN